MHGDARYKNLQTDNLMAKNIVATQITLQDASIKSDPLMAGATIKRLYEKQHNTNAFDNHSKKTLESLDASVSRTSQNIQMHRLPLLCDFDTSCLPNFHSVMCFDSNGTIVYVCNYNNTIKHFTLPVYKPFIQFSLNMQSDDTPVVKLDII